MIAEEGVAVGVAPRSTPNLPFHCYVSFVFIFMLLFLYFFKFSRCPRPISLLRFSLLRLLDSSLPGNPLCTWELYPLKFRLRLSQTLWDPESQQEDWPHARSCRLRWWPQSLTLRRGSRVGRLATSLGPPLWMYENWPEGSWASLEGVVQACRAPDQGGH